MVFAAIFTFSKFISVLKRFYPVFLNGLFTTLWVSVVVVLFGTILGAIITLLQRIKFKPLQVILSTYIEVLRGTPLLLQLYIFVFAIKPAVPYETTILFWTIVSLILNSSAYVSEVFRGGIQAVDYGQFEAAESLGLSSKNVMVKIILPQAIKNILPSLGNEFITMIKETSLASVFFINELMSSYKIVNSIVYSPMEPLVIIGITYFMLTFTLSKGVKYMEKRLKVSD